VKRTSLSLLALMSLVATAYGQALSQTDRDKGIKYLEQTRDGVVSAVKGLSDAQLKFKAAPDRWSVAETLEHIARAEDFIFQNISEKVMKAPAGATGRDFVKTDLAILTMVPDRTQKRQAPPELIPTSQWTPAQSLEHFLQSRTKTIEFLKSAPDLRGHVADGPAGQPWDAYEWVIFISAHSERHTKQIVEVKNDANFPRS
jgi:hypothetical protein